MSYIIKEETAFQHLFDVLRGLDMKEFTMTITCHNGVWTIMETEFEPESGTSVGVGRSFAEAYDQLPLVPDMEDLDE